MEVLTQVLPIVIDCLLIVLITVGIILLIKCIYVIDKAKAVILDVEEKVNSLNALFNIVAVFNDKIALLSDKVYGVIEAIIDRFSKRKDLDVDDEIHEYESKKKGRKRK